MTDKERYLLSLWETHHSALQNAECEMYKIVMERINEIDQPVPVIIESGLTMRERVNLHFVATGYFFNKQTRRLYLQINFSVEIPHVKELDSFSMSLLFTDRDFVSQLF